jgi:low temperature requirement protein LtrA
MASDEPRGTMFRALEPNQHSRVTNAELLFDLVFVFAVTQVSHFLLSRFTATGAVETALLFLAL